MAVRRLEADLCYKNKAVTAGITGAFPHEMFVDKQTENFVWDNGMKTSLADNTGSSSEV